MQRSYGVLPAEWIGRNIDRVTASCHDFWLDFQACSMSFAGQCLIMDELKKKIAFFCLILNLAACRLTMLWCAADEGDSTFS
jgi:hypothetical protein